MRPEVILIADAGQGIGWGHAVRQLALATALVGKGVRTLFVTRTREALSLDWPCPVRVDPPLVWARNARVSVSDLYPGGATVAGEGTLLFDDYGIYSQAARVDPHFGAATRGDAGFLGPRFAPLRAPFNDGWLKSETRSGVFLYGEHPPLPSMVLEPVTYSGFNARKAAATMGRCTLALVPPSMVALECLAIGTPVVLYVPGPKWQPIADAMEAAGVARIWSGRADDHTLGCVLADDGLRRRMSEAGREAVDGRGAERLAEWLA